MTTTKDAMLRLLDVELSIAVEAIGTAIAELAEETGEPYERWRERYIAHRTALERLRAEASAWRKESEAQS